MAVPLNWCDLSPWLKAPGEPGIRCQVELDRRAVFPAGRPGCRRATGRRWAGPLLISAGGVDSSGAVGRAGLAFLVRGGGDHLQQLSGDAVLRLQLDDGLQLGGGRLRVPHRQVVIGQQKPGRRVIRGDRDKKYRGRRSCLV